MSEENAKPNYGAVDAEKVLDAVREGTVDFDNPPQLSEEEKARNAKLAVLKKAIIERANEYVATPVDQRPDKKHLLAEIQEIVNQVDDAFVLMVYDKAGIPTCITFEPNGPVPEDPSIGNAQAKNSLDTPAS